MRTEAPRGRSQIQLATVIGERCAYGCQVKSDAASELIAAVKTLEKAVHLNDIKQFQRTATTIVVAIP